MEFRKSETSRANRGVVSGRENSFYDAADKPAVRDWFDECGDGFACAAPPFQQIQIAEPAPVKRAGDLTRRNGSATTLLEVATGGSRQSCWTDNPKSGPLISENDWKIGEPRNAEASGKASISCSLDYRRVEKGQRQDHAGGTLGRAVSQRSTPARARSTRSRRTTVLAKLQIRHQFQTGVLHGKCSDVSRPCFWDEIIDLPTLTTRRKQRTNRPRHVQDARAHAIRAAMAQSRSDTESRLRCQPQSCLC